VLGDQRAKTLMHIVTEVEPITGAIFSRNRYNPIFPDRVTFFDVDDVNRSVTTDRAEFIGRNGTLSYPDAMKRTRLSGKTGSALDPCIALQVPFDLYDDQEKEIVFRLGSAKNPGDAIHLAQKFKGKTTAAASLKKVGQYWDDALNVLHVETPDKSLDFLANGWLTYQTLACRIWARSGYYQSGGAFGFRDQLQDVISLFHVKPQIARAQILLCASRQYKEGDVQHWWHPPSGRGVRTRCSDDFLWLPFTTARYIAATGDRDILQESVPYLDGRLLNQGEESYYDLPALSKEPATLYEHCVAAVTYGLRFGLHGLPLIGSGDWNDGMDRVGEHGKGESIWLGFFLYNVLDMFAPVAISRGDTQFADRCRSEAAILKRNIAEHGWDGEWYRRAYFDNGAALGSAANTECRIDSISQSWSVLSGGGETERSAMGMKAVDKYLVRRDDAIIQLLDPPFDKTDMNPGYIKGYVPGVRENGGQYTHAAIWTMMAFAALGENEKVWELFSLINPLNHGNTAALMGKYKVEPYVIAADVYGADPHKGRGGWTWYTGSAGWTNHFILESLLGITVRDGKMHLKPCLPAAWPSLKVRYRFGSTYYHLVMNQRDGAGELQIIADGVRQPGSVISLADDMKEHHLEISIFRKVSPADQ